MSEIHRDAIDSIIERIDALEKEVEQLKKKQKKIYRPPSDADLCQSCLPKDLRI